MFAAHRVMVLVLAGICLATGGCFPPNIYAKPPVRDRVGQLPNARLAREEDVQDALWLEVSQPDGDATVGGYLSHGPPFSRSLIIVLDGASTLTAGAEVGQARRSHRNFANVFREAGFRTWTLATRERDTPIGTYDLEQTLAAIDWMQTHGPAKFGIRRVYLFGYSVGGTLAVLANRQRELAGVVAVAAITHPQQFHRNAGWYRLLGWLNPTNVTMTQLKATMQFYGDVGDRRWNRLDSVAAVAEFKSPMLIVHGEADGITDVRNARDLELAFRHARAQGAALKPLRFEYLPAGGHFAVFEAEPQKLIVRYLQSLDDRGPAWPLEPIAQR